MNVGMSGASGDALARETAVTKRERPWHRETETWTLVLVPGHSKIHVSVSRYQDGTPCEVFVSTAKTGTAMRNAYAVWGRTASLALQHGVPLAEVARSLVGTREGHSLRVEAPGTALDGAEVWSAWDALGQLLQVLS